MAWIRRLPSGKYQACYRDPYGKTRSIPGTFTRRTDAKAAADDAEQLIRHETWTDPLLARVTVAELADTWLANSHSLKPKTTASYVSLLSSRVLPVFGSRQLRTLKPSDIESWIGDMVAEDLSPSRIRQAHVVLRMVLDVAVRDGYLSRNVAESARLPRLEHHEAPFFEPSVVDALADAIAAPYGALVAVMGVCGLRWGEAVALRRRHVDSLRRRLVVEESLAEISGRLVFGDTKSHARRSVPVSPRVMALLGESLAGKGRDELVFTAPKGGPVRYQNFLGRVWHPLLEELSLPVVGVHVLRHSAAARMIAAGASAKTLQTVLGHRSAAFSLTVYGHLFDSDLDALAERLDTPLGNRAAHTLHAGNESQQSQSPHPL